MPKLEIHPFTADFLDDAARLLAERHRRHREAEPLLPPAYEDPAAGRAELEALLAREDADGVAGTRDGRVVAYVIGSRKWDETWGPNAWVEPAGHAAETAEDVRDLYGEAATRWVDAGRKAHFALVPATDTELVEAWFRLGFGHQQAYGVRELPAVEWPAGVREVEERDVDALLVLAPELAAHQRRAPVFSGRPPGADHDEEAMRQEILDDIASDTVAELVAERDRRIVGELFVCPVEQSEATHYGLARPERAALIAFAVTYPDVRGSGAGMALTHAAFAWARARRYEAMVADWRVTNLSSSRFWPARGFRSTFFRLHRLIA